MLVNQIATQFNGKVTAKDTVKFTCGDSDFVYTDGTIYTAVDGQLSGGFKKTKSVSVISKFVALRA